MYPEEAAAQNARELISQYGRVLEVCLKANGEIQVVFEKGVGTLGSIFKFGYSGTGPMCFAAWLRTAGCSVTTDDVVSMKAPKTLRPDGVSDAAVDAAREAEAEEQRRAKIQAERKLAAQCVMCGRALTFFQKLFGKDRHSACATFIDTPSAPTATQKTTVAPPQCLKHEAALDGSGQTEKEVKGSAPKTARSEFLAALSAKERCAVSNLNPLLYQAIIKEKKGEDAPTIVSIDDETDLNLVRKLPIADIEILCQSVEEAQKGDSAASRGDMAAAAEQYRKAFDLNPYNDLALMSYGVALAQQGNLREGIKWVEKAVKVNPDNERAKRNLKGMKAGL